MSGIDLKELDNNRDPEKTYSIVLEILIKINNKLEALETRILALENK